MTSPAALPGGGGERDSAVADGELLLIRSADGRHVAALQPIRHSGDRLQVRVWIHDGGGWGKPEERLARPASHSAGDIRLPLLGGTLEWRPTEGGRFRALTGELSLQPTGLRDIRELDPADPRWFSP